jgi:hypothetical protein
VNVFFANLRASALSINWREFTLCSGIPELPSATAFWQAPKRFNPENSCLEILTSDGEQVAEDLRFLGFEELFAALGPKLLYREAYARLRYELEQLRKAIVTGTPGTGKSLFGVALVCEASMQAENQPNVIYKLVPRNERTIEYFVFLGGKGYYVHGDQLDEFPTFMRQLNQLMDDPNTLLIVDGSSNDTRYMSARCKILQVVSPDYSRYHGFNKDGEAELLVMPLWSDAEIAVCREACYPHISAKVVRERCEKFGNIPRVVFARANVYKSYLSNLEATLNKEVVRACYRTAESLKANMSDKYDDINHKIVHFNGLDAPPAQNQTVEEVEEEEAEQIHESQPQQTRSEQLQSLPFRRAEAQLASTWVADRVISFLAQEELRDLAIFVKYGADSTMRGLLLERMAHKQFVQSGHQYQLHQLAGNSEAIFEVVLSPESRRELIIYDVSDLQKLTPTTYGMPSSGSFPSVDSVIRLSPDDPLAQHLGTEWVFLQVTVNKKHGVRWAYFKEMIDTVIPEGASKKIALIFVVTEREFGAYKEQKYLNKDGKTIRKSDIPQEYDISQYALNYSIEAFKLPDVSEEHFQGQAP